METEGNPLVSYSTSLTAGKKCFRVRQVPRLGGNVLSGQGTRQALDYGLERTEAEFRALLERAGFKLTNIIQTQSPMSVIEGRPVH